MSIQQTQRFAEFDAEFAEAFAKNAKYPSRPRMSPSKDTADTPMSVDLAQNLQIIR